MARVIDTRQAPRVPIFERQQAETPEAAELFRPTHRVGGVDLPAGPMLEKAIGDPDNGKFLDWSGVMASRGVGGIAEAAPDGMPTMIKGQVTGHGKLPQVPEPALPMSAPMRPYEPGIQGDSPHSGSGAGEASELANGMVAPPGNPAPLGKMADVPFATPIPFGAEIMQADFAAAMTARKPKEAAPQRPKSPPPSPATAPSAPPLPAPVHPPHLHSYMSDTRDNFGVGELLAPLVALMSVDSAAGPAAAKEPNPFGKMGPAYGRNAGGTYTYGKDDEDSKDEENKMAAKSIDALLAPLEILSKAGGHKYISKKRVGNRWVYDYGDKGKGGKGGESKQLSLFDRPAEPEKPKDAVRHAKAMLSQATQAIGGIEHGGDATKADAAIARTQEAFNALAVQGKLATLHGLRQRLRRFVKDREDKPITSKGRAAESQLKQALSTAIRQAGKVSTTKTAEKETSEAARVAEELQDLKNDLPHLLKNGQSRFASFLAAHADLTVDQVNAELGKLVKQGVLTRQRTKGKGQYVYSYPKPEEGDTPPTAQKDAKTTAGQAKKTKAVNPDRAYTKADEQINRAMTEAGKAMTPGGSLKQGGLKKIGAATKQMEAAINTLAETGHELHLQRLLNAERGRMKGPGAIGGVQRAAIKALENGIQTAKTVNLKKEIAKNPEKAGEDLAAEGYKAARKHVIDVAQGGRGFEAKPAREAIQSAVDSLLAADNSDAALAFYKMADKLIPKLEQFGKRSEYQTSTKEARESAKAMLQGAQNKLYQHFAYKTEKSMPAHTLQKSEYGPKPIPEEYLNDFLCNEICEIYEHEIKGPQQYTAHDRLDQLSQEILGELIERMQHNDNIRRACELTGCNKMMVARVLTERGLAQPTSEIFDHTDIAGARAMGAYEMEEIMEYSHKTPWIQAEPSPAIGVALAEKPFADASGLVKSDYLDPFRQLQLRCRDHVRSHWGVQDVQAVTSGNADCPVHGGRDLTKAMNLWNPMLPCTCGPSPNAYG